MKPAGSSSTKSSSASTKGQKRAVLAELRGKQLLSSDRPDHQIQLFAANGSPEETERAALRNEISAYLFEYLDGFHIPTHYIGKASDREMVVRKSDILPIEVCVVNVVNDGLVERYNIPEGKALDLPVLEHFYTGIAGQRTLANEHHLFALDVLTPEEFKIVNRIASKTNAVLRGLSDRRRLVLRDLRLYFGRLNGQLMLIDELSPATCRFALSEKPTNGAAADSMTPAALRELRDRLLLKV